VGASIPFTDSSGTLTCQNVDALDGTTLATIVAAISGNGSEYDDDASVCWGDDDDFCIEHDTDGSPDALRLTQKDCDGSPCDPLEFYKDGGANVVVLRASSVTNPDAKMTFGPAVASSHSLGINDSHFTGKTEVDSDAHFDSTVYIWQQLLLVTNKKILIGSSGNYWFTNSSGLNLELWATDSDGIGTDGKIFHVLNGTDDLVLDSGKLILGGAGLGCINQTVSYTDFTDGGGIVGTLVLDESIPDGAVVQRAILHSLTGFTGGVNSTATVQIGDGTVPARYNTGTPDVYTTNASGVDMGAPSGTAWHDAAKSVTITITVDNDWSTISAGEATVAICYWTP
jgi:hypothetical protein